MSTDGKTIATVSKVGNQLVYTLEEYVNTAQNVWVQLNFGGKIKSESMPAVNNSITATLNVNNQPITLPKAPTITIVPQTHENVGIDFKWMNHQYSGHKDVVNWGIVAKAAGSPVPALRISDVPGPGMEIRCPAVGDAPADPRPAGFRAPSLTVKTGTVRDNYAEGKWRVLPQQPDNWKIESCTPQRLDVLVYNVPADHIVEVNGSALITVQQVQYSNNAIFQRGANPDQPKVAGIKDFYIASRGGGDQFVKVGDFVWHDLDRDGIQDDGEPGIPGVVLEIIGPDGNPVRDIHGQPVGEALTGADGKYLFTNLPYLNADQRYTVVVKQDDQRTKDALADRVPTESGQGEDASADSSTWSAVSGLLTLPGQSDLSLDFGFMTPPSSPIIPASPVITPPASFGGVSDVKSEVSTDAPDGVEVGGVSGVKSEVSTDAPDGVEVGGVSDVKSEVSTGAPVGATKAARPTLAKTGASVGAAALLSGAAIVSGLGALRIRGRK